MYDTLSIVAMITYTVLTLIPLIYNFILSKKYSNDDVNSVSSTVDNSNYLPKSLVILVNNLSEEDLNNIIKQLYNR